MFIPPVIRKSLSLLTFPLSLAVFPLSAQTSARILQAPNGNKLRRNRWVTLMRSWKPCAPGSRRKIQVP